MTTFMTTFYLITTFIHKKVDLFKVLYPCSLSSYHKFLKFSEIPIKFPLIWYILGLCRLNIGRDFLVWLRQSTLFRIPPYVHGPYL